MYIILYIFSHFGLTVCLFLCIYMHNNFMYIIVYVCMQVYMFMCIYLGTSISQTFTITTTTIQGVTVYDIHIIIMCIATIGKKVTKQNVSKPDLYSNR